MYSFWGKPSLLKIPSSQLYIILVNFIAVDYKLVGFHTKGFSPTDDGDEDGTMTDSEPVFDDESDIDFSEDDDGDITLEDILAEVWH